MVKPVAGFGPRAVRDLREIAEAIAGDNPEAATQVRLAILDAADLLAQHPNLGQRIRHATTRHSEIRWMVVPRYRNYLLFYLPRTEGIRVLRVLHAARDWTRML